MDCSMPGFPVLHCLLEFAQTHIHWVNDAIQPSHPLLPPSPSALSLSQHSCPTPCDPRDYNLPDSSVHGIFQARMLGWVAISSSRGSFQHRNRIQVSCIFFIGSGFTWVDSHWVTWEVHIHTYIYICINTYIHTFMHACIHTYIYVCINSRTSLIISIESRSLTKNNQKHRDL